ncbi:hypothetical protein ABBQ38_001648 [Trebouxia sp. C0009 RCD-2024]
MVRRISVHTRLPLHQQDIQGSEGAELRSKTGVGKLYTRFGSHEAVKGRAFLHVASVLQVSCTSGSSDCPMAPPNKYLF